MRANRPSSPQVTLLEFSKRGHRFAFTYDAATAEAAIRVIRRFAADPDLPLTDDDADELEADIRRNALTRDNDTKGRDGK